MNGFVKVFASPGIDSDISEVGLFNSGATFRPEDARKAAKASPHDWGNEAPSQAHKTENLVGGFDATKSKDPRSLRVRNRGISPFGGTFPGAHLASHQHPGGIVDMNPGAGSMIAGGTGAASSLVRISRVGDDTRGMKLPVLPKQVTRGGKAMFPQGGGGHDAVAAPIAPKMPGFASIFSFGGKK